MSKLPFFVLILFIISCHSKKQEVQEEEIGVVSNIHPNFQLSTPKIQENLLILFPCFPCDANNTKREFEIEELAMANKTAILFMNFNQRLWLSEEEKQNLETTILNSIKENNLDASNTFIGGFSGGGNVSLLLSDYLNSKRSKLKIKGVFMVDAPIDLLGLYIDAKKDIAMNFSKPAVQEATWIVESFEKEFGNDETNIDKYEAKSPYLFQTHSLKNLSHLEGTKIRLYTEPDSLWWKENRQTEYQDMNAFYISHLAEDLKQQYGSKNVELIYSENRGYRANGNRHPHSWAIVEPENLIQWILENTKDK